MLQLEESGGMLPHLENSYHKIESGSCFNHEIVVHRLRRIGLVSAYKLVLYILCSIRLFY